MTKWRLGNWFLVGFGAFSMVLSSMCAQKRATVPSAELQVRIAPSQPGKHSYAPAVVWLDPLLGTSVPRFSPDGHRYTLLQKNRTFLPHFQVIPVGSSVQFPNADPFFHNVFSLFDGKRFDLGLYEAGSSKSVMFSREGVSYIFCNIHPEMSAIVISIATPLYAIADANELIVLHNVHPGDYKMKVWVEGVPQSILENLTRNIRVRAGITDLGELNVPIPVSHKSHTDKFGRPYEQEQKSSY